MTLGDALEKVESEVLEAKKELPDNVDDIAKEVAALANTKGGALIIGLSDEGELAGVSNIREVQERVAGVITQSIEPPVDVNIIRRSIADSNLLVVTVNKIVDTPRSVNGKYYKRVGTIVQEMAPEELTRTIQSTN
jgi:ATP-dependent DNA helicase RecG